MATKEPSDYIGRCRVKCKGGPLHGQVHRYNGGVFFECRIWWGRKHVGARRPGILAKARYALACPPASAEDVIEATYVGSFVPQLNRPLRNGDIRSLKP